MDSSIVLDVKANTWFKSIHGLKAIKRPHLLKDEQIVFILIVSKYLQAYVGTFLT